MISLSTLWGKDRFESYTALFLGMRETFTAFEIALPAWPGLTPPPAAAFRSSGVKCAGMLLTAPPQAFDLASGKASARLGLAMLASAADAARSCGAPGICADAGVVPKAGGWLEFNMALRGQAGSSGAAAVADGLAYRRESWQAGLETLARNLHAACSASEGVEIRIQTPPDPTMYPAPDELSLLFSEVKSPVLKYCHSAGRAAFLKKHAGWDDEAWLEIAGDRASVVVADDGCENGHGMLPGTGAVDFATLAGQVRSRTAIVLRPPASAPPGDLLAAAALLQSARLCRG